VPTPQVDGYIVGMHAQLVDAQGRRVTIRDVMLHHVVFRRRWRSRVRQPCTSPLGEAFYGTGEEDQRLRLPRGYGYRTRADDRWRMNAMVMSHGLQARSVYVQYRVTVDTRTGLTPVRAFWLRANGCSGRTSYPVYGGGGRGATDLRSSSWRVPHTGRIVAAGGHLHGGAKDMWLSQPRCTDRRLLGTKPYYGMPDHLYYRARPILHEPGPVDTADFVSSIGIPVVRGEELRLTGAYDAERPHPRVMSVLHVYIAPDGRVDQRCAPLPADRRELTRYRNVRAEPPRVTVPLTGVDGRGRTYSILDPPWPLRPLASGAVVELRNRRFSEPHVSLPAGGALTWRFADREPHNVSYASGPTLVGSPTLSSGRSYGATFTAPGRYKLFCYLHPVTMHQVIEVLPRNGGDA